MRDAICGDALVVRRLEDVVLPLAIRETPSQIRDVRLELLRDEDLVRERGERHVEVVRQLGGREVVRLGNGVPDLQQVRRERRLQVLKRRLADVVADDKEQERPLRRASPRRQHIIEQRRRAHPSDAFLPNRPRLTSNTVLSRLMLAPWYSPTWCSHMLTSSTSLDASENSADLRSKS